jgi:hypothetical protein
MIAIHGCTFIASSALFGSIIDLNKYVIYLWNNAILA